MTTARGCIAAHTIALMIAHTMDVTRIAAVAAAGKETRWT